MKKNTMNQTITQALEHYGSLQQLLHIIDQKLDFYLQIAPFARLLEDCGLHPKHMLDKEHPAYISDAIALRCLYTYDPQESDHCAIERCITQQLHQTMTQMEAADLSAEPELAQYPLDSLLRLVWRQRQTNVRIPFSLDAEDDFLMEVISGTIRLTQLTHQRYYEMPTAQLETFADFNVWAYQAFKLATEDYGYFVPSFVWLPATKKEE